MIDDSIVRVRDIAPYSCLSGVKNFCLCTGLDYHTFLTEGYPASLLNSFGDIQAERALRLYFNKKSLTEKGTQNGD